MLGHEVKQAVAALPPEPNRWAGRAVRSRHGPRPVVGAAEAETIALVVDRPLPEQSGDHGHRLLEDGKPLAGAGIDIAEGFELPLVPPSPDAEVKPSPADQIDGRGHLGHVGGVTERRAGHKGAEADVLGGRGEGGQRGEGFHGAAGLGRPPVPREVEEEVVGDPHGVEAQGLGPPGSLDQTVPGQRLAVGERVVVVGQGQPDVHRANATGYRYRRTSAGPVISEPAGTLMPVGIFNRG